MLEFRGVKDSLTVLTRLAARSPQQRRILESALRGRLEQVAHIALDIAVETGDPIGSVLAELMQHEGSNSLAESILTRFDEPEYRDSVSLYEVRLASTQRALSHFQEVAASQSIEQARLTSNLGHSLSLLGRQEQALEVMQNAVAALRNLSSVDADQRYKLDLAVSLSNLGVVESTLGNYESALRATEEAVQISRQLTAKWPVEAEPVLAQSLINQGSISFSSGLAEKALEATQEAVKILQRLADEDPGTFRANLARSLNNLGAILRSLGRFDEALEVASRGLNLRRSLAEGHPIGFLTDLAASLQNVASTLREQANRREEALTAIEEAVAIRRRLAAQNPEAALPDLADSLEDLAYILTEARKRGEETLAVIEEAVDIRRQVAARGPVSTLLDFVDSLDILAISLLEVGRRETALQILSESIDILQQAEAQRPAEAAVRLRAVLERLAGALEEPDSTGDPTTRIALLEHVVRSVTPFFRRRPLIFADPMNTALLTYLATSLRAGKVPDRELLRPIIQAVEKELLGGSSGPA